MKGSLNKGFFTYLLLFLGLIFAVVLILACIMFFSPGTEILGLMYINQGTVYEIKSYDGDDGTKVLNDAGYEMDANIQSPTYLNMQNLKKLIIEANNFDIKFYTGDLGFIEVKNSIKAFTKAKDVHPISVTKYYNASENSFKIVVDDSSYTLNIDDNREITVFLNKENYENLDIEVITGNGSIELGGSDSIEFNTHVFGDITATVKNGDISYNKYIVTSQNVSLSSEKGNIKFSEGVSSVFNNLNLTVGNGDINSNNLKVNDGGKLTVSGQNVFVNMGSVVSNIILDVETGTFEIAKVTGNIVDSNEKVKNVKVTADEVTGDVIIPNATSADITINNIGGDAIVHTESGAIIVKQLHGKGDIVTTSGKINLLIAENNSQNVNVTSEKGEITVYLQSVKGTNSLSSQKGNIKVVYKEGLVFKLVANASKVELKNENIIKEDEEVIGYPGVNDTVITTSNILNISTDKNVTIERKNSVVFE